MERVNCEDKESEQNTIKKRALLSYPAYIYPHEQSSSCLLYMGKKQSIQQFVSPRLTHNSLSIERGHDNNQQNKKRRRNIKNRKKKRYGNGNVKYVI
jgi:hypothetical protein